MIIVLVVFTVAIVAASAITILKNVQSIYDHSPELVIQGTGFDADVGSIVLGISATGQPSLKNHVDFEMTKFDDGLKLHLLNDRKWVNLDGRTPPVALMLYSVKFASDGTRNMLTAPVALANVVPTPLIISSKEVIYTSASNELHLKGEGLLGAKKLDLIFNPPLFQGANPAYEILSPFPLISNHVILRLHRGYKWREEPGPLYVVGVDTGAGPITPNGDEGVLVAVVQADPYLHGVTVALTYAEQLIYHDQATITIKGSGFSPLSDTLVFTNGIVGKGVDFSTVSSSYASITLRLSTGSHWRSDLDQLPGVLTLLAVNAGGGYVALGCSRIPTSRPTFRPHRLMIASNHRSRTSDYFDAYFDDDDGPRGKNHQDDSTHGNGRQNDDSKSVGNKSGTPYDDDGTSNDDKSNGDDNPGEYVHANRRYNDDYDDGYAGHSVDDNEGYSSNEWDDNRGYSSNDRDDYYFGRSHRNRDDHAALLDDYYYSFSFGNYQSEYDDEKTSGVKGNDEEMSGGNPRAGKEGGMLEGCAVATVFERPNVLAGNTKLFSTLSRRLTIIGSGFTNATHFRPPPTQPQSPPLSLPLLRFSPELRQGKDFTVTVVNRTEMYVTLLPGARWRSTAGPLLVTAINTRGDEAGWLALGVGGGVGVAVADVAADVASSCKDCVPREVNIPRSPVISNVPLRPIHGDTDGLFEAMAISVWIITAVGLVVCCWSLWVGAGSGATSYHALRDDYLEGDAEEGEEEEVRYGGQLHAESVEGRDEGDEGGGEHDVEMQKWARDGGSEGMGGGMASRLRRELAADREVVAEVMSLDGDDGVRRHDLHHDKEHHGDEDVDEGGQAGTGGTYSCASRPVPAITYETDPVTFPSPSAPPSTHIPLSGIISASELCAMPESQPEPHSLSVPSSLSVAPAECSLCFDSVAGGKAVQCHRDPEHLVCRPCFAFQVQTQVSGARLGEFVRHGRRVVCAHCGAPWDPKDVAAHAAPEALALYHQACTESTSAHTNT